MFFSHDLHRNPFLKLLFLFYPLRLPDNRLSNRLCSRAFTGKISASGKAAPAADKNIPLIGGKAEISSRI